MVAIPIIDAALNFANSLLTYRIELLKHCTPEQAQVIVKADVDFINGWNNLVASASKVLDKLKVE